MNMKLFWSAVTAGIIAGGGSLLTVMSDGTELTLNQLVAAGLVCLISAAKDWRAFSAKSPTKE